MLRWILLVVFFCFTIIHGDGQEDSQLDVATFTTDQEASITTGGQKHEFQAEVTRLMEIIINSLYKTRDIFLRELISNANDALDKIRYQSLVNKTVAINSQKDLNIRVQADPEKGTLTILDTGIGMTKEELAKYLGTIAHSGTATFLDAFTNAAESGQNPLQLIGQFGVGFYSAFLVADEVIVVSKSNNSPKQHIWRSTANGSYSISEDPRGNTLNRGTAVILKIKDDAKEFLDNDQIEKIITRYSEFMQYPILLYTTRTETVEESSGEEPTDVDEELKAQDEEEKPKEKKSEKTINYWKQLNKNKPLWTRRPSEISEEEYNEFYKAFAHATETPLQYTHFRAEGEVEFDSILFVPQKAPWGLYDNYYTQKSALRLYVRRVLVADKFEDIMPRYLNFMQGLIDSNDLPLNVNREDLQKNKILSLISRKLTRKALDMLVDLTKDEENENDKDKDKDSDNKKIDKKDKYDVFWKEFGKSIKLGVIEDQKNRKRLLELVRFPTSKSPNKPISLKNYIDNMKSGQKYIYYLSAASLEDAQNSPFLERLKSKDIEVLLFIDNLDEYMNIQDYDEYTLQSITKEGVEVDGKKMKEFLQTKEEEFSELKKWFKNIFGNKISKVQISSTLELSPMAISTSKFGSSANMERISKAQAFGGNINPQMKATKILEINYRHPIIKELQNKIDNGNGDDKNLQDYANLLLDMALIKSGFDIEPLEQNTFASRISRIVQNGLNIPLDTKLEDEPDFAKELTEEENEQENEQEEDEDVEEADEDEDKAEL